MTVIITGAAGGIGTAAAHACEDLHVLEQDVRAVDSRNGVVGDLRRPETLHALRRRLGDQPLHGMVLAHGIAGAGSLRRIEPDAARRIMQINFESVVSAWEHFAVDLEAARGALVVVSSQAALVAEADNGVYCASKSALVGWLGALAERTTARLRVVHPGATETPLLRTALTEMAAAQALTYDEILARRSAALPAGRLGRPDDMGAAIRWLLDLETPRLVSAAVTGGEVLS